VLIATWNVNSIRARVPRLSAWLEARRPDVVCLQELKCTEDEFPSLPLKALGYEACVHGQRGYNGVAILSRRGLAHVRRGLPGAGPDAEARVIAARVEDVEIVSVYAVNGQSVGSPAYADKLAWFGRLADLVASRDLGERFVLAGDFNVTFDDRDVYDPSAWRERILCSTPEREALRAVMAPGLADALRKFHEQSGIYTWWDYRTGAFRRDRGLRIDHFLMSPPALESCTGIEVDRDARDGEKPSDHAPVLATLAD
jgi:exodeoxyribonuclease-3